MNPGDRWTASGGLERLHEPPDFGNKMADLAALAGQWAPELERLRAL